MPWIAAAQAARLAVVEFEGTGSVTGTQRVLRGAKTHTFLSKSCFVQLGGPAVEPRGQAIRFQFAVEFGRPIAPPRTPDWLVGPAR
jgi:hypothetical protein